MKNRFPINLEAVLADRRSGRWRLIAWAGLVAISFAAGLFGLQVVAIMFSWVRFSRPYSGWPGICAIGIAIIGVIALTRRGPPEGWPWQQGFWRRYGFLVVAPTGLAVLFYFGLVRPLSLKSEYREVLGKVSMIANVADQFFVEFSDRLFLDYNDLVGADCLIKTLEPVRGEDYRCLFPIRRDYPEPLVITLSGGRKVEYDPTPWTGPMVTDHLPDGRVIARAAVGPPAPPPPDGNQTKHFPDGSRFEITYRGGVAHGPFRAYYPNGKLWGETTYERGSVSGPCWLYTRDGRRFNELVDRPR